MTRSTGAGVFVPFMVLSAWAARPVPASEDREPMLVVLRPSAAVESSFVRLADIADIPNDPRRLRAYAGEILLGFAPERGGLREIGIEEVEARLRESGLSARSFRVEGAARAVVVPADGIAGAPVPAAASPVPAVAPAKRAAPSAKRPEGARVAKGESVVIRSATSALVLEEPARALGEASEGETVEVQSIRTGRKALTKLVGRGIVTPEPQAEKR